MICSDIWHKYHSWYFKIVSHFTRLTAREITYNNFEISLVVFSKGYWPEARGYVIYSPRASEGNAREE